MEGIWDIDYEWRGFVCVFCVRLIILVFISSSLIYDLSYI